MPTAYAVFDCALTREQVQDVYDALERLEQAA